MTEKTKTVLLDTRALPQGMLHSDFAPLAASTQTHASIQVAVQIQRILDAYPDLLNHGWRTPSDPTTPLEITSAIVRQVQLTITYLKIHIICPTTSSYSLKHLVERWGEKIELEPYTYVQNSSAIVGALLSGYTPVFIKGGPYSNVRFEKGRRK